MTSQTLLASLLVAAALVTGAVASAVALISLAKSLAADGNWFETPTGIDRVDYAEINGLRHYIRIRGRDASNPVLIELHGGPGGPSSGYTHRSARPLTEFFTLVEWDQRGAGGSDAGIASDATYDQLVADTVAVIDHIRAQLGVKKVVLLGHSWGSMLGLGVAQARPDLLHAYVGVGQGVAWRATFDETQRLLLQEVQDPAEAAPLTALPAEWPPASDPKAVLNRIAVIQAPLRRAGHAIHASHSGSYMRAGLLLETVLSPDMSLWDACRLLLPPSDATLNLVSDLHNWDARKTMTDPFEIPIFIFQGDHDWQTPTTLVRSWFDQLDAPVKHYVAFTDSGHFVSIEEPGKYLFELVTHVRPLAMQTPK